MLAAPSGAVWSVMDRTVVINWNCHLFTLGKPRDPRLLPRKSPPWPGGFVLPGPSFRPVGMVRRSRTRATGGWVALRKQRWCGRSESNRHSFRNRILSPARLPVSPRPHAWPARAKWQNQVPASRQKSAGRRISSSGGCRGRHAPIACLRNETGPL